MNATARVYSAIMYFEGLRLVADAKDGTPTIGYGHTQGVRVGDKCSKVQALHWLYADLDQVERAIDALIMRANPTQGEFDALVDLGFNVGVGALVRSQLLKHYLSFDKPGAVRHFRMFVHDHTGAALPGLVARRALEVKWFTETV